MFQEEKKATIAPEKKSVSFEQDLLEHGASSEDLKFLSQGSSGSSDNSAEAVQIDGLEQQLEREIEGK